jgi:hypothetical protein
MPAYMTQPPTLQPRRGLTGGLPGYAAGSFPLGVSPARMYVKSVAVASNVVTLNVLMVEGNIPSTGAVATVTGITAAPAVVNVAAGALTGVTIAAATGLGTITYAATTPDLATVTDGGQVVIRGTDVAEALSAQKLQQFALDPAGGYGVTMVWACPSAPASIALQMEGAVDDIDAQYAIIGTSQTATSGSVIAQLPNDIRFVRANVTSAVGGTNPTLWLKFYQSTTAGN